MVVQLDDSDQALVFTPGAQLQPYGLNKLLTAGELALPVPGPPGSRSDSCAGPMPLPTDPP